jgi:hypothetical protein
MREFIHAAVIKVLDHLDIGSEPLRHHCRKMGEDEAERVLRQHSGCSVTPDIMGGLRGVGYEKAMVLIAECWAQAGIETDFASVGPAGKNLLLRVVDAASKHGAMEREKALFAMVIKPIDLVLSCPACGEKHVDAPDHEHYGGMTTGEGHVPRWENPPHRSHKCHACNYIWRPSDFPTNGVASIQTKGQNDSQPLASA